MDRASAVSTFVRSDGLVIKLPLGPSPFDATTRIQSTTYFPTRNRLAMRTIRGDTIVAELPISSDIAPLRDRPVVYLDQRDWSSISKAIHAPHRVTAAQRAAASALMQLVADGKVLLPMSSAHMAETCQWPDNDGRYEVALTVLQLSAGWQMRDPLAVRRNEIYASLVQFHRGEAVAQRPVFTLEPNAIHDSRRDVPSLEAPDGMPADMQFAFKALLSTSGSFDTMLDSEHVAMEPGSGWVEEQQRFTAHLATMKADSRQKGKVINGFFVGDTRLELAQEATRAGLAVADFEEWLLSRSDAEFSAMPTLGLYREVMREKHLNPGTRWKPNDLTDMVYLTCGAAYADYIVCEGSLGSALRSSLKRLGRPSNVMRSLEELVERLMQAGL